MTFKFFKCSPLYFFFIFVLGNGTGFLLAIFLGGGDPPIIPGPATMILFLSALLLTFYLAGKGSRGSIEATLTKNDIEFNILKPLLFYKQGSMRFGFSDIKNYDYNKHTSRSGSGYDTFELFFLDGSKYKISHDTKLRNKDEFEKFISEFKNRVHDFNKNNIPSNHILGSG